MLMLLCPQADKSVVLIGNRKWIREKNFIEIPADVENKLQAQEQLGHTAILVALDGKKGFPTLLLGLFKGRKPLSAKVVPSPSHNSFQRFQSEKPCCCGTQIVAMCWGERRILDLITCEGDHKNI